MTKIHRSLAAALAAFCALAGPAQADTSTFALTSAWQKVASAGQSVDVQNNNAVGFALLSTSTAGAPTGSAGQALSPGEHRLYVLGSDLYAAGTVRIVVTTGFGAGQAALTVAQTTVTLPAGSSTQLIGPNNARKLLRWMVTGSSPMTVSAGLAAAVVGAGMNYNGGSGAGQQGGSEAFDAAVPTGAFQAISAGGTTVTVWEGQ